MPILTSSERQEPVGLRAGEPISIAYLVSSYPTLSMAWLLREVLRLRRMGFRIEVAAVNVPDRPLEQMTADEADEARTAYHLKSHGVKDGLKAHVLVAARHPRAYFAGLLLVAKLGRTDLRGLLFHFMYFTEGLMVGVWMKRRGLGHLHVHLASQGATVGLYVRRVFGVGFSITVHGPDEFYDVHGQHLQEKVEAADFLCCISSYARSQLMRLSPYTHWPKLLVSRLGVDAAVFTPGPRRDMPDPLEVLCVGRLAPAKGQHLLIAAVARMVADGRRIRLRLVGDGPDGPSLREQALKLSVPETVIFEGAVNQDRIRDLYRMADVFCMPSFAEGIPVVLMEAMAMEIPCISANITGIPELIRDGVDGLLVPASDLDALTSALSRLMDDAELRERLGRRGRQRVLEEYDLERSVAGLARIFMERVGVLERS